jgi:hypothetical protein
LPPDPAIIRPENFRPRPVSVIIPTTTPATAQAIVTGTALRAPFRNAMTTVATADRSVGRRPWRPPSSIPSRKRRMAQRTVETATMATIAMNPTRFGEMLCRRNQIRMPSGTR